MAEVEQAPDDQDCDRHLLFLWIAFNALYGKWDESRQIPESDVEGIKNLVSLVQGIDKKHEMPRCLNANRELATELICDQYLNKRFWRTINTDRNFNSKKSLYLTNEWFESDNTTAILDELLERIYFNRCQLFHGAATFGSKLNRDSVQRSATMLEHILKSMIIVIIDHGLCENWGGLCYPPLNDADDARKNPISKQYPR